jgi:hypothetical protein
MHERYDLSFAKRSTAATILQRSASRITQDDLQTGDRMVFNTQLAPITFRAERLPERRNHAIDERRK